ncbi:MAG: hypothetical protein F6K48_02870 [Okeania sp. SIO3H1]|nr:hypothetical protein [Okeania sp. SIO3H1]
MGPLTDLPERHHFTRWWLRRYSTAQGNTDARYVPNRVVMYDRLLQEDVGEPFRYPNEFNDALQQLRMLRQRDAEPTDNVIFCDNLGDI